MAVQKGAKKTGVRRRRERKNIERVQHTFSQPSITLLLLYLIHRVMLFLGQVPASSASEAQESLLLSQLSQLQKQQLRLLWSMA